MEIWNGRIRKDIFTNLIVGDSSRDLEFHEPKTNSSNEEISLLDDSHNISESSKCVRLGGYCPKRIKMNGSRWTRTALEDDVFQGRKTLRLVSKTCGLMSNKHFYLFMGRLLMNPRERSWFYFVKPSLRLRYLEKQFKEFSADKVIPEPTQPTGADPTVPPLAPTEASDLKENPRLSPWTLTNN
ncbi:uncharacterized protein LOC115965931 [Quercus lobata]|uniref:uncharacterized protein LOC115965931 n=1 Tax=Quercus lobata TaxID=97700 RepID=UPI0012465229|nr:uncharacterized protein LOC115965931 [Quercus lobata]